MILAKGVTSPQDGLRKYRDSHPPWLTPTSPSRSPHFRKKTGSSRLIGSSNAQIRPETVAKRGGNWPEILATSHPLDGNSAPRLIRIGAAELGDFH